MRSAIPRPPLPDGPFLIVGLARSGVAAAEALLARGERVYGTDRGSPADASRLAEAGVELDLDGDGTRLLARVASVIKSPGVPGDAPVVAAARAGDTLARACLARYLERFGRALAVVVNILDPDVIVLGGGMSNVDELYTEGPAQVRRHVFHPDWRGRIVRNRWGDSSGVRGAAWLWDE